MALMNTVTIEFFVNDFCLIHWIVTKAQNWNRYQEYSKSDNSYNFKAVKIKFWLLFLDRYLFSVVSGNRYLHRGS